MKNDEGDDFGRMAEALRASGRFQVLERIERRTGYNAHDDASRRTALYVDVETTGLDSERDVIIRHYAK